MSATFSPQLCSAFSNWLPVIRSGTCAPRLDPSAARLMRFFARHAGVVDKMVFMLALGAVAHDPSRRHGSFPRRSRIIAPRSPTAA
jgi:hypothetical protein